jgi:hypothetical protein
VVLSIFCGDSTFSHQLKCKEKLAHEFPVLPWVINPYKRGVVREPHESEMAGELYGPNVKINPKFDRNGKKREDGTYLFAITRDADGQKRVLMTPRFEMDRSDKKYLNTHRSMFRKFRRELGDDTQPLVMGEVDIVAGQILGYRSKAGSAYDAHEAFETNRFDERRAIAEAMGFDLKAVDPTRLVNVARKLAEKDGRIKVETSKDEVEIVLGIPNGRHLEEEEYIRRTEIIYKNPLLKDYVLKIKKLMARIYELFPEHVEKNPIDPLNFDSPLMKEINVSAEDFQAMKQFILVVQDYGVESYVAYNVVFDLMPQLEKVIDTLTF